MEASRSGLSNCVKETVRKMTPEPSRHHLEASRPGLSHYVKETVWKRRGGLQATLAPDKVLENCTIIQIRAASVKKAL